MMADEEVTNMMVRADSFLPEGKLRMPDGEIRDFSILISVWNTMVI